jgi:hypothetical protein
VAKKSDLLSEIGFLKFINHLGLLYRHKKTAEVLKKISAVFESLFE